MGKKLSSILKEYIPLLEWGTYDYFKKPPPKDWVNPLPGGKADDKAPNEFNNDDLMFGKNIQAQHTNRANIATKIAMDHLDEHPEYYNKEEGLPEMQQRLQKKDLNEDLKGSYTDEDGRIDLGNFMEYWLKEGTYEGKHILPMLVHLLSEVGIPVSDGKFHPGKQMINSNLSESTEWSVEKFRAIEKAQFNLKQVCYNITDEVYLALVKERANLETNK